MDRKLYASKLSEYLSNAGYEYKYQKNDEKLFMILNRYGSLDKAIKNARKIHNNHGNELPSKCESCTTVYKFFDEIDKRLEELDIILDYNKL